MKEISVHPESTSMVADDDELGGHTGKKPNYHIEFSSYTIDIHLHTKGMNTRSHAPPTPSPNNIIPISHPLTHCLGNDKAPPSSRGQHISAKLGVHHAEFSVSETTAGPPPDETKIAPVEQAGALHPSPS